MNFDLIAKFLFLLGIANGAPIVVRKILSNEFSQPLDGGFKLPDGFPIFGSSKTIRGVLTAIVATALLAPVVNVSWISGALIGALAMVGDLISSFIKRRLGLLPSSRCTGLDQVPEALIPALAGVRLMGLNIFDVTLVVLIFFAGQIALSFLFYKIKLRRRPF